MCLCEPVHVICPCVSECLWESVHVCPIVCLCVSVCLCELSVICPIVCLYGSVSVCYLFPVCLRHLTAPLVGSQGSAGFGSRMLCLLLLWVGG